MAKKTEAAAPVGCTPNEELADQLAALTWGDLGATIKCAALKKTGFHAAGGPKGGHDHATHEHVIANLDAAAALIECSKCCLSHCDAG
jgi:hypothetical protein